MPRIARMVIKGEPAVYHAWGVEPNCCSTVLMSRTALDGFVLGDVETPDKKKKGHKDDQLLFCD